MPEQFLTNTLSRLRLRCHLLGCVQEMHGPCCHYCGEHLYEGFIQYGRLDPLFTLCRRIGRALKGDGRCGVAVTGESTCLLRKGHDGDHDDIPF